MRASYQKLGSRIRMLASAADAEVVSAARSAAEIMKSFGADLAWLKDIFLRLGGKIT
jgi:hypothetical protein